MVGEVVRGRDCTFHARAELFDGQSLVLVDVAGRSFGVLDDVHVLNVPVVEDVDEVLAIPVLELRRDRRDARVPALVGRNRVGDAFGDKDGLATVDGLEAVDGLVDGDVLLPMGGLGVLPAHEVGRVAVVPGRAPALVPGRPRDGVHWPTAHVEVREDVAPLPERCEVLGEEAGSEDRTPVVALAHQVVEQCRLVGRGPAEPLRVDSVGVPPAHALEYSRPVSGRSACPPDWWLSIDRSSCSWKNSTASANASSEGEQSSVDSVSDVSVGPSTNSVP